MNKNSKYIPPGRRNKSQDKSQDKSKKTNTFIRPRYNEHNKKKEEAIDLSITEMSFPKLEQKNQVQNQVPNSPLEQDQFQDYKNITLQVKEENTNYQENKITPGWVRITRNKDTNKVIFNYGPPKKQDKEDKEDKQDKQDKILTPYLVINKFQSPYKQNTIPLTNTTNSKELKQVTQSEIDAMYREMSRRYERYNDEQNELLGDMSPYINYKSEIAQMVEEENRIQEEMYYYRTKDINSYSDDDDDQFNDITDDW